MSTKIEMLKIKNARQKLLQRFDFLNIIETLNAEEKEGEKFFVDFIDSGIYSYDNKTVASFSFHKAGQIDKSLYHSEHQKARSFFIHKIKELQTDFVWISLCENGFWFFARVSFLVLCQYLDDWFVRCDDDFVLFIPDRYALAIHDAEYEWEVLEKNLSEN